MSSVKKVATNENGVISNCLHVGVKVWVKTLLEQLFELVLRRLPN